MKYPSFDNIIENLNAGKLFTFPGGVHPDDKKRLSNKSTITSVPLPEVITLPLRQHVGEEGVCCVSVGDYVHKGQPLSSATTPYAVPIHASTSGTVIAIEPHVVAHPSGLSELCVSIQPDGKDCWTELHPLTNYQSLDKSTLINAICQAGISGMGGAGFPTHIKAANSKPVEFLIINGAECEPYITADDRLMREHAWQIRQGLDILTHLINPKAIIIAIEDNKSEAIEALNIACQDKNAYRVVAVETKYPTGGEKQLIQVLTGREVPRAGLPADIGVMMFNVGTCFAIADAILHGKPLIERIVTITGEAVEKPSNFKALLGTPVQYLLNQAGYNPKKQRAPKVIMGGPMMGFTLADATIPIVKTTNCLLVPAKGELVEDDAERPCIRCSACADACPASLLPQQMLWYSKAKDYDKAEEYDLFDCIECGACAYVCPSEIPLVHYYRQAKSEIRLQRDEKNKAEKARQRFEARKERLAREKLEREEKHRKAKEARLAANNGVARQSDTSQPNQTKDKVAAALARAKAKKAAQHPPASDDLARSGDDKKAQVAAAIERAKAKKAALQQSQGIQDETNEATVAAEQDDKKARVAAAVARAKAKKAAALSATADKNSDKLGATSLPSEQPSDEKQPANDDAKKQRIAAAIAKAKAKKAQQNATSSIEQALGDTPPIGMKENAPAPSTQAIKTNDNNVNQTNIQDNEKQARIAAAVAKAKAKKEAAELAHKKNTTEETFEAPPSIEIKKDESLEKKRRIAAAIAKAKAKKAEAERENKKS